MKQGTQRRLERLEAQQAVQLHPVGQFIWLDLIDVSPEEAERRIAEAEAQQQPGDMLILVQGSTIAPPDLEVL